MSTGSIITLDFPDTPIGAFRFKGEDITRPWTAGELVILMNKEASEQSLKGHLFFETEKDALDEIDVLEGKIETIVTLQLRRGKYKSEEVFDEKEVRLKDVRAEIPKRVIINGEVTVWQVKLTYSIKRVS